MFWLKINQPRQMKKDVLRRMLTENPNYLYMLSDSEPTKVFKPAHGYNEALAESGHTMPSGHPEGIYEALANIYKGTAK